MQLTYIQFEAPQSLAVKRKKSIFSRASIRVLKNLLSLVFPKANLDFDEKIDLVKTWLVECDPATGVPEREIGLDPTERPS